MGGVMDRRGFLAAAAGAIGATALPAVPVAPELIKLDFGFAPIAFSVRKWAAPIYMTQELIDDSQLKLTPEFLQEMIDRPYTFPLSISDRERDRDWDDERDPFIDDDLEGL
jgi:hypothetical protein